jgi:hypothetical protein
MYTDDGDASDFFVVDGTISSWFGAVGALGINDEWSVAFHLEYDYLRNPTALVNQLQNSEVGENGFRDRFRQIGVRSERLGSLIIGKGSTASDETSHMLLSGALFTGQHTQIADMAGAMLFYDNDADELSDVTAGSVLNSYDGLGRQTKIRYDSPRLWDRVTLSGSVVTDAGGDVAIRYNDKWGDEFTVAAAAAFSDPESVDEEGENRYTGSFGILHSSGLNFGASFSGQEFDDGSRDDAEFGYLLLGYRKNLFGFGETRFGLEYAWNDNRALDDDKAESWGFAISQAIPAAQSEFYLMTRVLELDRTGRDFDDIWVTHLGWRLHFREPISMMAK